MTRDRANPERATSISWRAVSRFTGFWSGWNLNRLYRAPERDAPVSPYPQVDQRYDPDDGNHDIARDATKDVEGRVQNRDADIGNEHTPGQSPVTLARGVEDDPTENRRPQAMTKGCGQGTNHLLG